ncbi:hypothetical protein [Parapedobacter sp. 2B3]
MKSNHFSIDRQQGGGAILERPIPFSATFGWLSNDDEDEPKVPKCNFTPL